jgi:hypothetical protein
MRGLGTSASTSAGPLVKDKLFFYGNFNPSYRYDNVVGARNSGLAALGEFDRRYSTYNYAAKLDWNLAPATRSTSRSSGTPRTNKSSFSTLNIDNTTADSKLDYGTRNIAVALQRDPEQHLVAEHLGQPGHQPLRRDGLRPLHTIWTAPSPRAATSPPSASASSSRPTGRPGAPPSTPRSSSPRAATTASPSAIQYQRGEYSGIRDRSGPRFTVPATNTDGTSSPRTSPRASR